MESITMTLARRAVPRNRGGDRRSNAYREQLVYQWSLPRSSAPTTVNQTIYVLRDMPAKLFTRQKSDGMTLDEEGNLYITHDSVQVYSPKGDILGVIKPPEKPANVTFCHTDRKTLFITARTSLYAVRMNVSGQSASPPPKPPLELQVIHAIP